MRCHYCIFNTRNIRETIESFASGPYYHLFKRYVIVYFVDKNADRDQTWLSWIRYKASELLTPLKSIKFAYIDSKSRSKKILNLRMKFPKEEVKFTTKSSDSAA